MSTSIYITMKDGSIQHAKYYKSTGNGPKIDGYGNLAIKDDLETIAYMPAGTWTTFSNELPCNLVAPSPVVCEWCRGDLSELMSPNVNELCIDCTGEAEPGTLTVA